MSEHLQIVYAALTIHLHVHGKQQVSDLATSTTKARNVSFQ